MTADPHYTAADHGARDEDSYAAAKYRLTLRWLQNSTRPAGPLFNIGCGAGLFNTMAVSAGYRVEAFEPDPVAFNIASMRCHGTRSRTHNVGLMDIEEPKGAAIVVMHDVLEHIEDDEKAARKVHGLLEPGGVLVVSVPALPSLFGYHDEQLGHYRRYTRVTLEHLLTTKFNLVRVRYFGMSFIPLTLYYSRVRRLPYRSSEPGGIVTRAFDLACRVEERIPTPIGTSLLALAVRR